MGSAPHQRVVSIPVLKNAALMDSILHLSGAQLEKKITIVDGYEFGGYAKKNSLLIEFMNEWFVRTGIPSDFVYTGKLFYAVNELISQHYFPDKSRIMLIHSGGLQGNHSLPKGTLIF
jgi:1-aminocyclopropane-1-carboxylate deaminase